MTHFNIHKVLVAPLDWGLGHATRCIPLIRALTDAGYTVIIAAAGSQAALLQQEFPSIPQIELPGYQVRYASTKAGLVFKLMQQIPRLYRFIEWEHRWLDEVIDEYQIDLVISDNRYGLWTHKVPSVIITHQLQVKAPNAWAEKWIQKILYRYINRYTMCWVPDMEEDGGLAGLLSHPASMPKVPVAYMGLLCRFEKQEQQREEGYITVLLSGPEPQRTMLEEKIAASVSLYPNENIRLVRGLPGLAVPGSLPHAVNHLPTPELQSLLTKSKLVICRGGYTSLMELMHQGIKMVLVPTPGQTEQEYLANRLAEKGYAMHIPQQEFDLQAAIENAAAYTYRFPNMEYFTQDRLRSLMEQLTTGLSRNRK